MFKSRPSPLVLAIAGVTAVVSLAALAPEAMARERHGTFTGPKGNTATHEVEHHRGDVSSSTTGQNGKSTSRFVDRSAGGAQAMLTGPNGKTTTRSTIRTDTGSTSTLTGPNGKSTTVDVTRQP